MVCAKGKTEVIKEKKGRENIPNKGSNMLEGHEAAKGNNE